MSCSQCIGIEEIFNDKTVTKELADYRRKGPDKITRTLIDAIKSVGIPKVTLLDIGGGVGAIQHELLKDSVQTAVDIDASSAYLTAARREAVQRGIGDRIRFLHGNFVDLAADLPPADIVTLNRVICCYNDMVSLVNLSAERAKGLYGLVYPRNDWYVKLALAVVNLICKIQNNPYRAFVHPTRAVENLIEKHHLRRIFYQKTLIWQVAVYSR